MVTLFKKEVMIEQEMGNGRDILEEDREVVDEDREVVDDNQSKGIMVVPT